MVGPTGTEPHSSEPQNPGADSELTRQLTALLSYHATFERQLAKLHSTVDAVRAALVDRDKLIVPAVQSAAETLTRIESLLDRHPEYETPQEPYTKEDAAIAFLMAWVKREGSAPKQKDLAQELGYGLRTIQRWNRLMKWWRLLKAKPDALRSGIKIDGNLEAW